MSGIYYRFLGLFYLFWFYCCFFVGLVIFISVGIIGFLIGDGLVIKVLGFLLGL